MHKVYRILSYLGLITLFVIALALIFNQQIAKFTLETYHPKITKQTIAKAHNKKASFDWQKVNSVSATDIVKARFDAKDTDFIGYVAVPEMKISLPISAGTAGNNLAIGAATLMANQVMGDGNYVLASHMVYIGKNLLFSPLYYHKNDGVTGQKIYLTDLKNVYEYKTIEYKTVPSTAVDITYPVAGKKIITLFTCNYSHDKGRVMLRGELVKITSWQDTENKTKKYFTESNA